MCSPTKQSSSDGLTDDLVASSTWGRPLCLDWWPNRSSTWPFSYHPDADIDAAGSSVIHIGYQFRGEKGAAGGSLFVLDHLPGRRMVHLPLAATGDDQWERYLALRDRLRSDVEARKPYSAAKGELRAPS